MPSAGKPSSKSSALAWPSHAVELLFEPVFVQGITTQHYGTRIILDHIGNGNAQRRHDSRVSRDQNPGDSQLSSQFAGVHWPGSAERDQRKLPRVVATFQGDGPDGAFHVGVDDANDSQRRIGYRSAYIAGQISHQPFCPLPGPAPSGRREIRRRAIDPA